MNNRESFPNNPTSSGSSASGETTEKLKGKAAAARERVDDAMEKGRQTADQARTSAASGLERAASKVHETATRLPGGPRAERAAHAVASGMERSATYLREHDLRGMMSDAESFVRRHPTESLIAALATGFLLGQAMRRSRD